MGKSLAVKSAVRKSVKGMRVSKDFFNALDACIAECILGASKRAKANGRKTLRGYDL